MVMRKILFWAAGLSATLISACATDQSQYGATSEALYQDRFDAFFGGGATGLSAYDPLVPLIGAEPAMPLPVSPPTAISGEAINAAIAYAGEMNSSSLIIWHKGAVVSETYFGANERATPIISRSLAKPLATIAVGRAIAEGHIASLDQPVADFFPEWQNDERSEILIRHLLDMRTGLLPQGFADTAEDILNRAYLHPKHDEIIINDYPLVDEPGTRYEYANANSELVAPLIERATGQSYEDWVSQQILLPIGAPGGEIWVNRPGGTAHSGCCALLPPEAFLRLAILLLQDGDWQGQTLLPDGYVTEMRTPTPQHPHAGMGVYIGGDFIERRGAMNLDRPFGHNLHSEPYLADDVFLFDGNGHQVGYVIPSADLVILRTGIRPDEGLEWDNSKLPNTLLAGMSFEDDARPNPQPYQLSDTLTELSAADGRAIPLRLIEPVGCSDCPLVIFSHGAFSTYDRYDAILLPLARAGYRIAAPNHVDSEAHPNREAYGQPDAMGKRVEDYAVIAGELKVETVFAVGHSFGGLIAQIAGGASLSGPAAALTVSPDDRPDALIAISPPGPMTGVMEAEGWAKVERPQLVVTGTTDILPGFVDDWRDHLVSYEAATHDQTVSLVYTGMDHYLNGAYGRETDLAGDALSARTFAVQHLVGAIDRFLDAIDDEDETQLLDWSDLTNMKVAAEHRMERPSE
ncbi:MAG: alpha/beta fold hydrolase [Pseudomonadota bacterium]